MSTSNSHFYSQLPVHRMPLSDLLIADRLFHSIPADWHVIITDIKGSTSVVQAGQHETVNLVATGSIVAVLNISFKANITIPFFFGGDGATFIVPPGVKETAMQALRVYKKQTSDNYQLELRVGCIAVADIYAAGQALKITRFNSSGNFSIPVILGDGLNYAERLIKGTDYIDPDQQLQELEPDLSGMQCRWDRIKPPQNNHEVVSLIVTAAPEAQQAAAFREVMLHIDEIYGGPEIRQPISVSRLRLTTTFNKLRLEIRSRFSNMRFLHLLQSWLSNSLGYLYFQTRTGRSYLHRLVEMSDTLVIDGKINTVISGTEAQRLQLETALNTLEQAGRIRYGIYVSKESVMSCYVRDMKDGHIHFVDGADGGYTKAAGILKIKLGM
ncbi:DUF3095 domain-containing protein [uncultured Chitinophaga sp.]|jgi:Protein of unknown function (DUF3095).|uniref:DUF3095 domain-containing protein n=1 Tax=uncultured Chitinophaga sp. TaxID=339340 RepID=UPI0026042E6F|nr:DUF3095 domain-containing protein [uncultured Chitinophaga sp.]